MGDIADQMLEGSMCQWCGIPTVLDFPGICAGCQGDEFDVHGVKIGEDPEFVGHKALPRKYSCPVNGCTRKLRTRKGVAQHVAMKHVEEPG